MRYKEYEEYRNIKFDYVKKIPSHWTICSWRYITKILTDYTANGSFKDLADNVKYLDYKSYARVVRLTDLRKNMKNEGIYVNEDAYNFLSKSSLAGGEFLISNVGAYSGLILQMPNINYKATLGPNMMMAKFNEKVLNRFMIHLGQSEYIKQQFSLKANSSSAQPKLNKEDFRSIKFLLPPIEEQEKIVEFLDKKTSEIDKLIEEKEKLIELLKEKREAIITEAVTKGLDKNVKMKDSGVEWIGEIPEQWNAKKLRYLGELQNGISKSAQYFGKGFPFVSYSDVYKNEEIPNEVNGKLESTTSERELYSVKEGDVFFTRTSETIEEIGFASTCFSSIEDSTFAGFLIRFRPNEKMLYKGFSKYYFRSNIHRRFFVKEMNIVTRASLSQELLKQLPVLIPPINEQKKIYNFLNRKISDIDKLIIDIGVQINNLNEYKKSLISEIVTGKIDVRNEA
ncbi:restriction endonuclease subunit S [Clostridium baratii]|uniref:restriction endonuclease subunit S n=1 Tax=Clostridium baratii TaxID=1561 RepID=UPI001CB3A0B2|nr:restriction endonuclease subunit S [Clostridium baratii]STB71358.1 restriction modification system DNA specificity subunit [Clostridium baratii]